MAEQKENNLHQPVFCGGRVTTHKWCDTCMFCDNDVWFPQMRYCKLYTPKDTHGKPDEVIYEGARCEFYEKQK